jgi:ABC-type phosphate transport system permease subunit
VAEEDALRRQDHLFRGVLMVFALIFAFVLAVYACKLATRSADQANRDNGLRFTSHWGGFGGSAGGWRVTPAFVSLLGAGLLAAMAAVIVSCILESTRVPATSASAMPSLPTLDKK